MSTAQHDPDGHDRDEHDGESGNRSDWRPDPTTDYAVGPDDVGNVVMHGVGFLVSGWRWITGKFSRRT